MDLMHHHCCCFLPAARGQLSPSYSEPIHDGDGLFFTDRKRMA